MNLRGVAAVAGVECSKLFAQLKVRLLFAVCVVAPFGFAAVVMIQTSLPTDTLFGRAVKDSGLAVSLVILGFATLWGLPVVSSIAGGDVFSAEDRHNTWKTVLTRSRTRTEIFTGKLVAALGVSFASVVVLALSSLAAGVLVVGAQPLVGLSGVLLSAPDASARIGLAWLSVLPPVLALTGVAIAVSIVTRNGAAGVGLPVLAALAMQLLALIDGPELPRRLLVTSAFGAWHGLLADPPFLGPLFDAMLVSAGYAAVAVFVAHRTFRRREIGG
jgi:ABC-2 type transport system permease protein